MAPENVTREKSDLVKPGPAEFGFGQVCPFQNVAGHIRPNANCPCQVGTLHVGIGKTGCHEHRTAEFCVLKTGFAQGRAGEITSRKILPLEPLFVLAATGPSTPVAGLSLHPASAASGIAKKERAKLVITISRTGFIPDYSLNQLFWRILLLAVISSPPLRSCALCEAGHRPESPLSVEQPLPWKTSPVFHAESGRTSIDTPLGEPEPVSRSISTSTSVAFPERD